MDLFKNTIDFLKNNYVVVATVLILLVVSSILYRKSIIEKFGFSRRVFRKASNLVSRRKKEAQELVAKKKAEAEAAKKKAEEAAKKKAEDAKKKAEELAAKKQAEEAAKKQAEAEAAKKQAEAEAAKKKAEAEAAKKQAEAEAAKKKAEAEAAKKQAEQLVAKKKAELEAAKKEETVEEPVEESKKEEPVEETESDESIEMSLDGKLYAPYKYSEAEKMKITQGTLEEEVCKASGNLYTGGENDKYPGCGTSFCCKVQLKETENKEIMSANPETAKTEEDEKVQLNFCDNASDNCPNDHWCFNNLCVGFSSNSKEISETNEVVEQFTSATATKLALLNTIPSFTTMYE